jgi:hypothetical protein
MLVAWDVFFFVDKDLGSHQVCLSLLIVEDWSGIRTHLCLYIVKAAYLLHLCLLSATSSEI